jgi:hypothetical protein
MPQDAPFEVRQDLSPGEREDEAEPRKSRSAGSQQRVRSGRRWGRGRLRRVPIVCRFPAARGG